MKTRVEFAARFWYPGQGGTGEWGWQRAAQTLWVDLPGPGQSATILLPAPMFSYNSASHVCLELNNNNVRFTLDSYIMFDWTPWHTTSLWTQHTFDPGWSGERPHRGGWWLRYRCPNATGPTELTIAALNRLAEHGDPAVVAEVQRLRRELVLHHLGRPVRL